MGELVGKILLYLIALLFSFFVISGNNKSNSLKILMVGSLFYFERFTSTLHTDFVFKLLFLVCSLYLLIFQGFKKEYISSIIIFFIAFLFSRITPVNNGYYNFTDSFLAMMTFLVGLLLISISWSEKEANELQWLIILLPWLSVLFGTIFHLFGIMSLFDRNGTSIGGISLSTNLSFYCVFSIAAASVLFERNRENKFIYIQIITFLLCSSTLTRGGILASLVIIFPDILWILLKVYKKPMFLLSVLFSGLLSIFPIKILYAKIIERMYNDGGSLNTSGRIEAWSYIIRLQENRLFGNGFGSLKTYTYDPKLQAYTAAHNEYIRIFFETGIVGSILILISILNLFLKLISNINENKKSIYKIIFLVISFFIYSLTDNTLSNYRYWFVFMILLGTLDTFKKYKVVL